MPHELRQWLSNQVFKQRAAVQFAKPPQTGAEAAKIKGLTPPTFA
jgi:hypothetical protein